VAISSNQFTITFDQAVNTCTWIAQLGNTGAQAAPTEGQGFAYTGGVSGFNDRVRVWTHDKGGSVVARPFHLAVFC
jgi:hypothetical protein